MNPLLAEILSGPWLISTERSAAYASVLLSLIKGESIFESDSSLARERNRPYILAGSGGENQRLGFSDTEIPAGSVASFQSVQKSSSMISLADQGEPSRF